MLLYAPFIIALTLFVSVSVRAQEKTSPLAKRVIVKTNVLSLLAQRPAISVEKVFSKTFSAEASFVQGQFNNFLFTDHYNYSGFLIRVKKHFGDLDFGEVSPYIALYAGNLKRNIQTTGQTDNSGWFGYPSRNFSANSIRGGGSLGLSYFTKSKFVIDAQYSMGYGKYTKFYKPDLNANANGYLDVQVWLSVGYCF
jgi:hypothetical protein